MSDVIKSITNDLRAAASSRVEQQQKADERMDKLRETNAGMFKSLVTAKYRLKPGANAEDFLSTGDVSMFEAPPSELQQLQELKSTFGGKGGGMEQFPQGTTMKYGNFQIPLNPPQTPERANTISALETMSGLLGDMNTMLTSSPHRVATGNIPGVNFFDRQANAIFRLYDKTAAIAAGGKQLTQTELALIASNRPTVADIMDPKAMQYKMNKLKEVLTAAHDRLTRGLAGETQMGAGGMLGGDITVISPDGTPGTIPVEDLQQALAEGYTIQGQ